MEVLILIVVMVVVGLLMGWVGGLIWKDNRPIGVRGDYIASVITTVVVGLLDWFVIPAMGFSDIWRYLGVAMEPAIGALIVMWLFRVARKQ